MTSCAVIKTRYDLFSHIFAGCNLKKFSGDFVGNIWRPVTGKGPTEPNVRESARRPVTEKLPTELFEITGVILLLDAFMISIPS